MAWFWQRKTKQREEQSAAQQEAATKKRGLFKSAATPKSSAKGAKNAKASEKKTTEKTANKKSAPAYGVLLGPVVTEKAARLAESGTFVFTVSPSASKIQIRDAVSSLYGVHAEHISLLNTNAKPKVFGFKQGRRSSYRKAYVTLKSGEHIDFFESERNAK